MSFDAWKWWGSQELWSSFIIAHGPRRRHCCWHSNPWRPTHAADIPGPIQCTRRTTGAPVSTNMPTPRARPLFSRPAFGFMLWILCVTVHRSPLLARGANHKGDNDSRPPISLLPPLITDWVTDEVSLGMCNGIGALGNMTSYKHKILKIRTHRNNTWIALLLMCGDIHPNPGPQTQAETFPCGFCDLHVSWSQRAVACDECNVWYHKSCMSMISEEYASLEAHSSCSWCCMKCNSLNVDSFTFHAYEVHTNNSFEPLASIPGDDSVFLSPSAFAPTTHSSPTGTRMVPAVGSVISSKASGNSTETNKGVPTKGNNVRVIVANCNGVRGKKAELENLTEYVNPDILILTETKIDSDIKSSEFLPEGYKGDIRKDRNATGGGVMLAYKDTLIASEVETKVGAETVWGKFTLKDGKSTYVGAYYRPPSDRRPDSVEQLGTIIDSFERESPIILGGDFNARDIDWDTNTVAPGSDRKKLCEELIEVLDTHHLEKLQREPTRGEAVLDLYCTNRPGLVKCTTTAPGISDHHIIVVDSSIKLQSAKKPRRRVHQWSKANWDAIREETTQFGADFLNRHSERDLEENYAELNSHVQHMMDKHIPTKLTRSSREVPWITQATRRMCRKKQRLYNKAKKARKDKNHLWAKYNAHKKATARALKKARWSYINGILQTSLNEGNSKPFWRYMYSQGNDGSGVAPLKDNGTLHSDGRDKANILNNQFASVFSDDGTHGEAKLHGPCYPPIGRLDISVNGVEKLLSNINPSKATGPDMMPCRMLKELAPVLAPLLTVIFQQSLATSKLPTSWLHANIVPVFKKGTKCLAENYRPVSLTCVACKLLEHIVCSHIRSHLDKHRVLSQLQHGFRSAYSCETQLLTTLHDLLSIRDKGVQVDIAVLDFSKALDKVPHRRLLSKLRLYGIHGPICNWIEAFLSNRTQRVQVEGQYSRDAGVTSGVPQGTVMGPLLFLLFINDLPSVLDPATSCRLFADDCLIYREHQWPAGITARPKCPGEMEHTMGYAFQPKEVQRDVHSPFISSHQNVPATQHYPG